MKQFIVDAVFGFLVLFLPAKRNSAITRKAGVATLLCHRDVSRYICSIASLFYYLGYRLPLYVVDDGTMTADDKKKLHRYFSVQVEDALDAERKVKKLIKGFSHLLSFRFDQGTGVFKKKLDVYLLSPFNRFIYLDSDILFFQKPTKIIQWMETSSDEIYYTLRREDLTTFSSREAVITQYAFRKLLYHSTGSSVHPLFIAGFLCVPDKKSISPATLNKNIGILHRFSYKEAALAEETAVAMSLNQKKIRYLPIDRYININCREEYTWSRSLPEKVFIHYSGHMKLLLFEIDAIHLMWKTRFFTRSPAQLTAD